MTDIGAPQSDLSQSDLPLARIIAPTMKLSNTARAEADVADLLAQHAALAGLVKSKPVKAMLTGLAEHAPYLWGLVRRDPEGCALMLAQSPRAALDGCLSRAETGATAAVDDDALMEVLRQAKRQAALLIALADLGHVWSVLDVTAALTRFADVMVTSALNYLLRQAIDTGRLVGLDRDNPALGCGVVVLALGKHGAGELNYSSDIDLIVFFDPACAAIPAGVAPAQLFVRMTKALARLLQERTGDGYVLRVDLRLRPDPGSTAVAISLPAAFAYYERLGQNWERAALIKARPVAGDVPLGQQFLADLAPFIWRKYFDYSSIADIHAMKRQIHAVRGHAEVAVAGHDLKLGRGGIREVEFFVQTQQLIFGGRRPGLRGAKTLQMLVALFEDGWITPAARDDLREAYLFLRSMEHRLQMRGDEQTQRLPMDPEDLERFAQFAGYKSTKRFGADLTKMLSKVEEHYARLFENAPGLDSQIGSLVFTGVADDPETLETLEKMGFRQAHQAAETVRGWHFGRRAAVQSPRAREVLTELVPALLEAFAGSGDPDAALAAFDEALSRMPAAAELFSILRSNAQVRELFGDILGGAPRLAHVIAQRPHVLDAAIDPASFLAPATMAFYTARADALVAQSRTTEEFLDGIRIMAQEEAFLIGVRTLSGAFDPLLSGEVYTALAQSVVQAALAHVQAVFMQEHGIIAGGACVILAMGKFGSQEMTATSDLDLMLLYEFADESPESDGRRPLHATQYYSRLAQRLISALTVATRRGRLYDVDMRLRPSGRQGPVATRLKSFSDYQRGEAEIWEHMALTRGRVVAGDANLAEATRDVIAQVLSTPCDETKLRAYVYEMRHLIAAE